MKNIKKQIAEGGRIIAANSRLDLTVSDVMQLAETYKSYPRSDDLLDVIVNAYKTGVAVGTRNGKRQAKGA